MSGTKELVIGQNLTMFFEAGGMTSDEEIEIIDVDEKHVYLERDEDETWKFSLKTGKCLNDNTFMGARRYITPIS